MMCTNMTTILSHQVDLGPSVLDVKYEGLGGTCLVTTPLNMAPNLSECNVSHGGIAQLHINFFFKWLEKTVPNYRKNRVRRGNSTAAVKQRLYWCLPLYFPKVKIPR